MAGWEYDPDSNRTATEKRVQKDNPARLGMIGLPEIKGTEASYQDHMYAKVNQFKEIDLYMCKFDGTSKYPWRSSTGLNTTYAVSDKVRLFTDDLVFSFGYQNSYNQAFDGLKGALGGALGMIGAGNVKGLAEGLGQGLEFARSLSSLRLGADKGGNDKLNSMYGGKFGSKYEQSPYWEKTTPITFSKTMKFNFAFGQAGLYSGLEEVVKPISKLASLFAPVWDDRGGGIGYLKGLWPTMPFMLAKMLQSLTSSSTGSDALNALGEAGAASMGALVDAAGNIIESAGQQIWGSASGQAAASDELKSNAISGFNKIVEKATVAEEKLLQTFNSAILSSYGVQGETPWNVNEKGLAQGRAFMIKVGKFWFGPYIIKNCDWTLDFTQTDEYGFPYKGTLQLSQIELVETTTTEKVASHFVYS